MTRDPCVVRVYVLTEIAMVENSFEDTGPWKKLLLSGLLGGNFFSVNCWWTDVINLYI
jgi:hypothetical protein